MKLVKPLSVLLMLFLLFNIFMPRLNFGTVYYAENLPSILIPNGEKRVNEQNGPGFLTFGLHIPQTLGKVTVIIYYNATSDSNTYDIYSYSNNTVYIQQSLASDKKVEMFDIIPDETVKDLEFRTIYGGQGEMTVEKIEIITGKDDLFFVVVIYDAIIILITFIIIIDYIKKKYSAKRAQSK